MNDPADPGTITCYIAASVDGYVATPDGGVEWLESYEEGGAEEEEADGAEGETEESGLEENEAADEDDATGFEAFFADVDCLLVGSTTYEQVLGFGEWPYGDVPTYVATNRDLPLATDAVELGEGDADDLAERLRDDHEHVWLVGGAAFAQSMFRAEQVDELRLSVIPTVLGDGIALFEDGGPQFDLSLVDTTTRESDIVELHYEIEHWPSTGEERASTSPFVGAHRERIYRPRE